MIYNDFAGGGEGGGNDKFTEDELAKVGQRVDKVHKEGGWVEDQR